MKVKFKNTEVDVWKVRKGVVVRHAGGIHHIVRIGLPNVVQGEDILVMDLECVDVDTFVMSYEVEWLEPH